MKSLAQKLAQIKGLLGTRDLTAWEHQFVEDICERTRNGNTFATQDLTVKQVEAIDRIYGKHFA